MINLAWNRDEIELAEVLTGVLYQHQGEKHSSARRLRGEDVSSSASSTSGGP